MCDVSYVGIPIVESGLVAAGTRAARFDVASRRRTRSNGVFFVGVVSTAHEPRDEARDGRKDHQTRLLASPVLARADQAERLADSFDRRGVHRLRPDHDMAIAGRGERVEARGDRGSIAHQIFGTIAARARQTGIR